MPSEKSITSGIPIYPTNMTSFVWFMHKDLGENEMQFSSLYPERLSYTEESYKKFKEAGGEVLYLMMRDKQIGQTCFMSLQDRIKCLKNITDEEKEFEGRNAVYVWNFAVLPEFRHQGIAHILKSYFIFFARRMGYRFIIGHCTLDMMRINRRMGAHMVKEINNYEDTGDTYFFYRIVI